MNAAPYAGFWKRLIAFVLDSIIAAVPPAIICVPLLIWQGRSLSQMPQDQQPIYILSILVTYALWQVLSLLSIWLYFAFLESGKRQATFGKRIMKIKVIGKDGQRISFARASGRIFAKFISYMTLYIGFIMAGLTNRKRALHDYIAETYVVREDFQPTDTLPDTPSHPWWLAFFIIAAVALFGAVLLLGVFASLPAGKAFQAAAQLQTLAQQTNLPYGTITAGEITYYHFSDGYRASFEDENGEEYTLYLPLAGETICCEEYPGNSCEAIGFEECE